MARVRIPINPMQVGKVGAYSMYVRKGEQIVRQRRNSSNYGEEASRSLPQQQRRVLWSNLVNFYKTNKAWMPKAFENIKPNQTVYNRFMQLNVDNFGVALTKEQASQGWCIVDNFRVSDGSLYPVRLGRLESGDYRVSLTVSSSVTAASTLGDFSKAIVDNNIDYQDGDNIAVVLFEQRFDAGMYPLCIPHYFEVTLNVASTAPLSDNELFAADVSAFDAAHWNIISTDAARYSYHGLVAIHTRKSGGLKVSTQDIVMEDTTFVDRYGTAEQVAAAIASYGLDSDVPLAPSFSSATIEKVTLNGSIVPSPMGRTIEVTDAQELKIQGKGINSETVRLVHDGTEYTPLVQDANSVTYLLGSNGSNRVEVSGRFAFNVVVSGIVMPSELPKVFSFWQIPTVGSDSSEGSNFLAVNTDCINYPFKANDALPAFLFRSRLGADASEVDNFTPHNCSIASSRYAESTGLVLHLLPVDASLPCFLEWKGYIVAVFNYS